MAVKFNGTSQGYCIPSLGSNTKNGFTWCGFIRPEAVNGDTNFRALVNFAQAAGNPYHIILWQYQNGSSIWKFLASFDDESPDFAEVLNLSPVLGDCIPQWYFCAFTDKQASPHTGRFYAKPIGCSSFTSVGDVPNGGNAEAITSGLFGVDVFNEWGKSSQCGHKIWNHVLSPAELALESKSIRAVKKSGLIGEYPLNKPELTDYSGQGHNLSLDGSSLGVGTLVVPSYTPGPNIPQFYKKQSTKIENLISSPAPSAGIPLYWVKA